MILNIILFSALAWTTSKCEPPVNSYLPPSSSSGGRPSSQYGTPGVGGGISGGTNRPGSGIGNQQNSPQDNYLPPGQSGQSNSPDSQYGQPSRGFGQGSSNQQQGFGPQGPQGRFPQGQGNNLNVPSSEYGAPGQRGSGFSRSPGSISGNNLSRLQSSYDTPNRQPGFNRAAGSENEAFASAGAAFGQRPESSYGPPSTGFQSPTGQSPNPRLGAQGSDSSFPSANGFDSGRLGSSLSSGYGTPGFGSGTSGKLRGGGRGSNFDGSDNDEPAKYEFSYDVNEPQTGTKFGHSERRDGDLATGEYNVVLPDGRKQVVEYEAGLQGYKPQIRYEGTGGGAGSNFGLGSGGPQSGNQGYARGSPGSGFPGSGSGTGYSGSGQGNQPGQPERYQEAGGFGQGESQSGNGYPRGGPNGNNANGSSRGYPSGGSGQGGRNGQINSQGYPGSNNEETLNGGTQGYPRGGPQRTNGLQGGGRGYSNRGSQNSGSGGGGEDGYPSGRPTGPQGSGY